MKEADELENFWSYQNYNVPGDITYHNALLAHFFRFRNPKLENRRWNEPVSDFERTEIANYN